MTTPLPEVSELALRLASRALRRDVDGSSPARELWQCAGCRRLLVCVSRPTGRCFCAREDSVFVGTVNPPPPVLGPAQELHALARDIETFAELVAGKSDDLYADLSRAIKGMLRPPVAQASANLPSLRRALEIAIKDATAGWRPLELSSRDADALLEVLAEVERWRAAGSATAELHERDVVAEARAMAKGPQGGDPSITFSCGCTWHYSFSPPASCPTHAPPAPGIEPQEERTAPETPEARAAAVKYVCSLPTCLRRSQPTTSPERCGACGSLRIPVAPGTAPENLAEAPPARYVCSQTACGGSTRPSRSSESCHRCGAPRVPFRET